MQQLCRIVLSLALLVSGLFAPLSEAQEGMQAGDSVLLEAGSIGVGGVARIGDWAGIEIQFQDASDSQRELIIQIEGLDSDGDSPLYQRTVTSNPGVLQKTWLYLWIPGTTGPQDTFKVSVYEALDLDAEASERSGVSYRRGQLLARKELGGSKQLLDPEIATGLVIGRRLGGLADYSRTSTGNTSGSTGHLPYGHEITLFTHDIRPNDLPDRAIGLSQFETIIWSTADPAELTLSRSDALIEWVRSGGHLVVCLPTTGLVWFDDERNALASLLPDITHQQLAPGSSDVHGLLTLDENATLPSSLIVTELTTNAAAEPTEAMSVLQDREGRTVVSRRVVDLGMVTLIGIDITNRNLADRGLPAMEAFWHRVLGKRGMPIDRNPNNSPLTTSRELRYFDKDIAPSITSSGSAGLALLLGFALFATYWGLGGPLGYAILNQYGLKKHTWLAFVAAIGLFTLIGWGGVSAIRPRSASMQQVVFLDAIEGGRFQRTRSYANVFFPGYADASLRVGDPDNEFGVFHNTVSHWNELYTQTLGTSSFPDARSYAVSARDADVMRFPARATDKKFRLDWTGPERWPMPNAVSENGGPGALRLVTLEDQSVGITGSLTHNLPGTLKDVVIVVSKGQRSIGTHVGQSGVPNYNAYKIPGGWPPGQPKDLATLGSGSSNTNKPSHSYFDDLLSKASGGEFATVASSGSANERLIANAFVSQLKTPARTGSEIKTAGVRQSSHGLDVGKWLTQPCVMVLGVVELSRADDATNPLPVFIKRGGGWNEVDWSGKVVVRWIYPLGENPPEWRESDLELTQPATSPAGTEGIG